MAFGVGLSEHVREVYRWIADTWVPGDGVRGVVERISSHPRSEIIGSRRVPEAGRLELVVALADDVVDLDGTVHEGTTVADRPVLVRESTRRAAGTSTPSPATPGPATDPTAAR